jgi:8-oxo-dGTP diphosphatase
VGAIITDDTGRLLLIKRGHEPEEGRWSLPGGRVRPGESDLDAVAREVCEETGLRVEPGRLIGEVERPGPGGTIFDIHDYAASVSGGQLEAGDDAAEARWVDPHDIDRLDLTSGLARTLAEWGVLS